MALKQLLFIYKNQKSPDPGNVMYSRKLLLLLLSLVLTAGSFAQSFPAIDKHLKSLNGQLQLRIKKYKGTELLEEQVITQQNPSIPKGWKLYVEAVPVKHLPGALDIKVRFLLEEGFSPSTAVELSFDFAGWHPQNYVMVPAIVYNGNRYRSIGNGYNPAYPADMYYNPAVPLTISNNPRLSVEEGKASVVELETGNKATPAFCFYSPSLQKNWILLTDQRSVFGNHGLTISENAAKDQCRFSITAPAMRKMAAGFGDFQASGDRAPDWKAGDELSLVCRVMVEPSSGIPGLLTSFMQYRKSFTGLNQPRNWLPMSYFSGLFTTITSNNFRAFPVGSYYLPENSNDFQLGWVSGMINTYPMLALNDEKERNRVQQELDFVVEKMQGTSGYFYGGITAKGELRPEKMNAAFPEPQAMVRKNADALLWLLKHFQLFRAQGHAALIKPAWETAAQKLAEAFSRTWKQAGEFGQYITPETGKIAVYNSTAGAVVPGAMAMAASYFKRSDWLQVAREAAQLYFERDVVKQGLTGGDCGDISMDANSESAFGLLESLMALYYYTKDKTWLRKAEVQAALCASWTISYDPVFPANSQIGKLGSKMAGAVWASIQNKHAAPGICTASGDYLFKLFRATGKQCYADLIRDIQHAQAEAVNIPPHHLTTNNLPGSSMERIQPSDAEGRGSTGNYINTRNSWTETNGALMALELPGIYVQRDKKRLQVFDHVEAKLVDNKEGLKLVIKNPTAFDARVAVFIETSKEAALPLSYTAFLHWPKIDVPAGGELVYRIGKSQP
ncbi:hypothetical protein [Flavihumibacter sp. CACIAM 22H1]|uniref:hypothetical protein n=1 Tax=Flavihumibacter sp. CACIAM 22H1 TaxID=1812911 RepID=UPI0007A8A6DE|nr:hypothetical protein [Flavihumibacter sp. CACIAM 22H1]KYP15208.1 MAG: hypothetical protein A1D16_03070 [Flavihumibacter sp. CACIAM 22H1]